MAVMKRALLIALVAAFAVPAHAGAAVPCRNKIFNDWYADGKIASTYPRGCYADALRHIPPDAQIYSSLADDIRAAMRAAARHQRTGKVVPAEIGHGFKAAAGKTVLAAQHGSSPGTTGPKSASAPQAVPVADTSGGGSSLPVPILVLGALALLLAAAGVVGGGVRYAHGRRR